MTSSRLLGIDYGTKRIGIAMSDENNTLAFPKNIINNDAHALEKLVEIIETENIQEIVVGESLDFSNNRNALEDDIDVFVLKLEERLNVIIHREKEFWTSVEARRFQGSSKRVDASAAALILQRYLDKINNKLKPSA